MSFTDVSSGQRTTPVKSAVQNKPLAEFIWHIPEYSKEHRSALKMQAFLSPTFSFEGNAYAFDAMIQFYPKLKFKNKLAVLVFIVEKKKSNFEYYVQLSYLMSDGSKKKMDEFSYGTALHDNQGITECLLQSKLKIASEEIYNIIQGCLRFRRGTLTFNLEELSQSSKFRPEYFPNDTLTICCSVYTSNEGNIFLAGNGRITYESRTIQEDRNVKKLITDLESLLFNPGNSDALLKSESEDWEIFAHKTILAARSPKFAAIFQKDGREKKMPFITQAVLRELLRFIYTGNCQWEKFAEELLYAAETYGIEELKLACEQELRKRLTVSNAVSLLALSARLQTKKLMKHVALFISQNKAAVFKKPEWNDLIKSQPELMTEIELVKRRSIQITIGSHVRKLLLPSIR